MCFLCVCVCVCGFFFCINTDWKGSFTCIRCKVPITLLKREESRLSSSCSCFVILFGCRSSFFATASDKFHETISWRIIWIFFLLDPLPRYLVFRLFNQYLWGKVLVHQRKQKCGFIRTWRRCSLNHGVQTFRFLRHVHLCESRSIHFNQSLNLFLRNHGQFTTVQSQ